MLKAFGYTKSTPSFHWKVLEKREQIKGKQAEEQSKQSMTTTRLKQNQGDKIKWNTRTEKKWLPTLVLMEHTLGNTVLGSPHSRIHFSCMLLVTTWRTCFKVIPDDPSPWQSCYFEKFSLWWRCPWLTFIMFSTNIFFLVILRLN